MSQLELFSLSAEQIKLAADVRDLPTLEERLIAIGVRAHRISNGEAEQVLAEDNIKRRNQIIVINRDLSEVLNKEPEYSYVTEKSGDLTIIRRIWNKLKPK